MIEKRAIIWDFDGTLAFLDGMWSGTCMQVLEQEFHVENVDMELIKNYLSNGFPWHNPTQTRSSIIDADIWWHNMDDYFQSLGVKFGLNTDQLNCFTFAIRTRFLNVSRWSLYDGSVEVLRHFKSLGIKNYILSNHVPELRMLVKALQLDTYFEAIITSGLTGVEKPNVKSFGFLSPHFNHIRRQDMLIVGDSLTADYGLAAALDIDFVLVHGKCNRKDIIHCKSLIELKDHCCFVPLSRSIRQEKQV